MRFLILEGNLVAVIVGGRFCGHHLCVMTLQPQVADAQTIPVKQQSKTLY